MTLRGTGDSLFRVRGRLRRGLGVLGAALLLGGCAANQAYQRGRELAAAQDWDRAVQAYSKAVALKPERTEYRKALDLARVKASQYHLELAKGYLEADVLDLAIVEFKVAAALDPTNRYVADSLANALELRKDREAALAKGKSEIERLKEEAARSAGGPILQPASEAPLAFNFPPNTKVKDIYQALGKAAGINMLFDSGIRDQETFNIELANVSFKKALDQVAIANRHFYKVIDEKTLMIAPDNPQKRRDYEDHVIKTFYLSNANPNDVVNTLRGLLDARRIATNPSLNAITIRDTPAKISVMEKVIESNDKPPSEVVIDVEILELRNTESLSLGAGLSTYKVTQTLEQADEVNGLKGLRWSSIPFINASDWLLTFPDILYQAEKSSGRIRTLARPSLRALDGKQVTLRLGDQVPIETSTFSAGVVGSTVPLTRNFQFRDIGTNIDITPRVHHNNEVTLQLQVEVTSVGEDPDGAAGPIPPTFGNRRINTEIRLKDGETNLLAGLFTSSENSGRTGLPIIGDLPVLRNLFTLNSRSKSETDIVLTLTPHIVRTPNIRRQDLEPFYVGTETNVGGVGDVGLGGIGGSPFQPPEGESHQPAPPQPAPGRFPRGPGQRPPGPGQPSFGVPEPPSEPEPGQPSEETPQPQGRLGEPVPGPPGLLPERGQPSPTAQAPGGGLLPGSAGREGAGPRPASTPPAPPPAPAPVAPAVVTLEPATVAAGVGQEFTVQVLVRGATGVSHAPFYVSFDPALVEALWVQEGDFLRSDGKPTMFLSNIQPNGRIVVGLSRLGRAGGVDGNGVLAAIRFRARAAGTSSLGFSNAYLRDADQRPLPASFVPATVSVF